MAHPRPSLARHRPLKGWLQSAVSDDNGAGCEGVGLRPTAISLDVSVAQPSPVGLRVRRALASEEISAPPLKHRRGSPQHVANRHITMRPFRSQVVAHDLVERVRRLIPGCSLCSLSAAGYWSV